MLSNMSFSHSSVSQFLLLLCIFHFNSIYSYVENMSDQMQVAIPIGVVRDMNSSFDAMLNLCMDMAISDFYSSHSNYKTRLQLIKKDANNALDHNLAVLELVKHDQVVAILGTQGSMQEIFAVAVGEAALVPIVSFTARSSAFSCAQSSFHFKTALDDAVQAKALAAICERFEWSKAVILYEDTVYGAQFLSHTIKAFQSTGIRLTYMMAIPTSAEDSLIKHQLNMINAEQTRVFLVHSGPVLGSRLFTLANAAGMMSEGYAWIITDSISIFLNSISSETRDSMDGVVGIQPYVSASKSFKSFHEKWKRSMLMNYAMDPVMDLNIYGLWAYDTVTALAIAVENTRHVDSSFSSFGARLASELPKTKFRGLAGDFELVEGKLKDCAYEIFNMIGNGERKVGFWSLERGITREVSEAKSNNEVRKVFWPGDSVSQPKGWSIPPTGSLRVGVPWRSGFTEFAKALIDPATNVTHATGFAVDVFIQAVYQLPFPLNYTFHCINTSTGGYSGFDMLLKNNIKEFDIVVADTTIWAPRADYVDFSLPYSESGIVLVVKNKKPFDMWIFVRPLRWDLWLAIVVTSMLMGIVLRILENQGPDHAERPGLIYWSPIAILAFQDRHMVSNNWSVFVLVCWLFMAFVLMQSFTANLSAILTLDQLKFSFSGDYYVGYQEGSFMRKFLIDNLNINGSSLRGYSSVQEFHDAMCKGSKNGGVDAIFDELPYMKLLLNRYKSQYKIVGPTYNTDGFGFAFPLESPLVGYFSKAILNVTQGPTMNSIEQKNLGPGYSSQDPLSSVISQGTSSLTLQEFAGLFLVTGSFVLFALLCSHTSIGGLFTCITQHFIQSCLSFRTQQPHSTELSSSAGDTTIGGSNGSDGFAHTNGAGEGGGDERVIGDEAAQILETVLENQSSAAQNEGRVENEELPAPN